MKSYTTIFAFAVVVGVLSVIYSWNPFNIFVSVDLIVSELGPLLSPGSSILSRANNATSFKKLTERFVPMFCPDTPAVVTVATEADIPIILNYARRKGRPIIAASGRHGWGASLNNLHNGIMIDMNTLSTISISTATNTMTVGGGIKMGAISTALHAVGKETSIGVCSCVGFFGAGLGGGHGLMQGLHGLISDNLISARLVIATGEVITVSNTSHPDLFWALQGAGHNFGIVTEAEFRIYEQTNGGMQFNADILYGADQLEAVFTAVNAFENSAHTSIFILFISPPELTPIVTVSFVSSSTTTTARTLLDNTFGHIPHLTRTESVVPWDEIGDVCLLGFGSRGCLDNGRKNIYPVTLRNKYDIPTIRAVFDSFADFVTEYPGAGGSAVLFETYPLQAIQAVPETDTAYPHRDAKNIVMAMAAWEDETLDGVVKSWLESTSVALHKSSGYKEPVVYLNYAQDTEGFGAMYGYEEWRREKLVELKRKWDGEGVFSWYHPIPKE